MGQKTLESYLAESDALIHKAHWEAEYSLMREALADFPSNVEICLRYAVAAVEVAPEDAVDYALRAVRLSPDDPGVLVRSASLLMGLGEVDHAGRLARRASSVVDDEFPLIADLFQVIGRIGIAKKNDAVAEEYLRLAFTIEPDAVGLAARLATFLAERERYDEALDVAARGLEHAPPDQPSLSELRHKIEKQASS